MFHFLESLDIKIIFWINQSLSNPVFDFIMPILTNENYWVIPIIWLIVLLVCCQGK